jgi:hypothetical protein
MYPFSTPTHVTSDNCHAKQCSSTSGYNRTVTTQFDYENPHELDKQHCSTCISTPETLRNVSLSE